MGAKLGSESGRIPNQVKNFGCYSILFDRGLISIRFSGGHDKSVRVWNLTTGTSVHELYGHEHVIEAVAWAPPASNPWIEDVENAKELAEKQTEQKYFASVSRDKSIKIW
jgi:WD40 repeat protein